jgi:diguanylate cyclase (GGDEF)-like protein
MTPSLHRQSRQSIALLIGIVLTMLAVAVHDVLPERRLTLDATRPHATYFLMHSGDGGAAKVDWVDQSRMLFRCSFPQGMSGAGCSYTYLLYGDDAARGTDLSHFDTLNLAIRYTGKARYLRVAIRNFDPQFSRLEDSNSSKYNSLSLQPKDLLQPIAIRLGEFTVPEWWVDQYSLPRQQAHPAFDNATAISIDLLGDLAGTDHDIAIERLEFSGEWIAAETWYLGILCAWLLVGTIYGATQLVVLRRKHREQRQKIRELADDNAQLQTEKDKFEKLSTVDGLTKTLNRHGIEQFIAALANSTSSTSVIVIDLDHFKKVNDHRGHHAGDRVLQTVGEVLRLYTRHSDGLGRWGGEEFVLVCPGASLSKAAELAEKLRHKILQTNFIPEDPVSITASFGVATLPPGGSFEEAFRQADEALYLAKSRGRNCVVAAGDDQMHRVTGARKGTWALISGRFKLHGPGGRANEK